MFLPIKAEMVSGYSGEAQPDAWGTAGLLESDRKTWKKGGVFSKETQILWEN